jgi:hypothetical protein
VRRKGPSYNEHENWRYLSVQRQDIVVRHATYWERVTNNEKGSKKSVAYADKSSVHAQCSMKKCWQHAAVPGVMVKSSAVQCRGSSCSYRARSWVGRWATVCVRFKMTVRKSWWHVQHAYYYKKRLEENAFKVAAKQRTLHLKTLSVHTLKMAEGFWRQCQYMQSR